MALEWKDLNLSVDHCPDLSVEGALRELVTNAIDAAPTCVPEFDALDSTTVVLRDEGPGLDVKSFVVGRSRGENKRLGRFGIGFKDALATLIRHGAQFEVASHLSSYRFEVKKGPFGEDTIHLQQHPPSTDDVGTCITVSNLPDAAKSVRDVKALFLCWSKPTVLHSANGVDVLEPPKKSGRQRSKHRGQLFVSGVAMKPSQVLHLSYSFETPSDEQRKACDRDHNVEGDKFHLFKDPIEAALLSLPRHHCPSKPSCEFNWKGVKECFFQETVAASAVVRRGSRKLSATEVTSQSPTEWQRLCQQLAELAELPPPRTNLDRLYSISSGFSTQSVAEPATKAEVDKLIHDFSQDAAVPEGHEDIVGQLSSTLEECSQLGVSTVHRGGFYAKGSSHVDLIVVLNGIPTSNHERWLYVLLAALRTTVERNFPDNCQVVGTARYALQLRFPGVNIDLLPVPAELWEMDNQGRSQAIEAKLVNDRRWLSTTFAQEQADYVKSKEETTDATGIIRLIKCWVQLKCWRSKPSSYCIELLAIHAVSIEGHEDKLELLRCFWQRVRDYHYLEVVLDEVPHADIAAERPLVVDPTNPINNVAGSFDWREWQQHAARICDSRLREFVNDLS